MIPVFKIRASAAYQICGGMMTKPTDKQLALLAELEAKPKRTEKQQKTLEELIAKRDAGPSLQEGAKTYCQKWLKEQLYQRAQQFTSKYTDKGNECEPDGLKMIAEQNGYANSVKNEQFFKDEHFTGTPDLLNDGVVDDCKCSWDETTFPLFEPELPSKDYWAQMQVYMELTGKGKSFVNYCLIDAPEHFVEQQARIEMRRLGMDEMDFDLYNKVAERMTYSNLPIELRYKRYEVVKDDVFIAALRKQVELCREYINSILPAWYNSVLLVSQDADGTTLIERG